MAKQVSVKSIRELAKQQGINEIKSVEISGLEIEIKNFLPTEEKREIALLINQNSFIGDGDIKLYDKIMEDVVFGYFIVSKYTNINLMKDHFEFYDCIKSSGLLDAILSYIDEDEIKQIREFVASRREDSYRVQELRGLMGYKIEDLFEVVKSKIDEITDKISNFDPKTLETLTSFIPEEQRNQMFNKSTKQSKADKEELQQLVDDEIQNKIKIAEDKIQDFKVVEIDKVEKSDALESPTMN